MNIQQSRALRGVVSVPGDKSISHRAVMFGAIAEGTTTVRGFLKSADCLATIDCFRRMGIEIEEAEEDGQTIMKVHGKGLYGLREPEGVLDAKNSGTTTRLISGILAGQTFAATIAGDASLSKRPMGRVIDPLTLMGAKINASEGHLPMTIHGGKLHAMIYHSPVASAQVKSCIALAGLYAEGETCITEPYLSRNHTELLLRAFGAEIWTEALPSTEPLRTFSEEDSTLVRYGWQEETTLKEATSSCITPASSDGSMPFQDTETAAKEKALSDTRAYCIDRTPPSVRLRMERIHREMYGFSSSVSQPRPVCVVRPGHMLHAIEITVPGDISSAAFFLAAASLVPGSELVLKNVGINPTRTGVLSVLMAMGGQIALENERFEGGEPVADLRISYAPLKATYIGGSLIPTLIDELPILAVLAAFADGTSYIRDAAELRVKESDRIAQIVQNLRALGIEVFELPDGMIIHGNAGKPFCSAVIDPHGDHRLAMAFAVAGLAAEGGTTILDEACVAVSYPGFFRDLASIGADLT